MITAIIIAYNNERYIRAAIESALKQQPPFAEIIVVEDCSTDTTLSIIKDICSEHSKIELIGHSENKGAGAARNTGIEQVKTPLFCFLDGDDLFLSNSTAVFQTAVEEHDADLWMFSAIAFNEEIGDTGRAGRISPGLFRTVEEKKVPLSATTFPWNKLYRTDMVRKQGIRFPNGRYEDIPWCVDCILSARVVSSSAVPIVHYRIHQASLLQSKSTVHFEAFEQWQRAMDLCVGLNGPTRYLEELRFVQLMRILENDRLPTDKIAVFLDRLLETIGPLKEFEARLETQRGVRNMRRLKRMLRT
ncbi:MAG: glycosyltransferase family 2 protein [Paracoccaceae bacterium]